MKKLILSLSALLLSTGAAWAAGHGGASMAAPAAPAAAPAAASTAATTDGEVRKVDKANKKITLKHGEIKNLDMPGMTMVFQVKDPAMLEALKVGDKVRFTADKAGSGYAVTTIEKAD